MAMRFRGQRPGLSAAEINDWNQAADRNKRGELEPPTLANYNPSSRVAFCKNVSGSDRAQFECMSISGMVWDLETDGSSGLVFELDTADAAEASAILATPIADGQTGMAVIDGLALALVKGGTGSYADPDPATHKLEPASSGAFRLLSAPHATNDRLLPVVMNTSSANAITDLRLSGNNLQYLKDGTWTTWHTAETC